MKKEIDKERLKNWLDDFHYYTDFIYDRENSEKYKKYRKKVKKMIKLVEKDRMEELFNDKDI